MGRTDQYNGVDQDKCYLNIPYMLGCPGRPILSFWCQENNTAKKVSGIYRHRVNNRKVQLVRGFDDVFLAPHSRNTESSPEDIRTHEELVVLAESDEVGDLIVMTKDGKQIFVLGHLEYDRLTLDKEYKRDMAKGLNPEKPYNYYPDDNPDNRPLLTWRATSDCLYSNWLNYYVYQTTPYDLTKIR